MSCPILLDNFDSCRDFKVGGSCESTAKALCKGSLPNEKIAYLGDTSQLA